MTMFDFDVLMEGIEAVGSRLEKERLLAALRLEHLPFLRLALDPAVTFGITVDEDEVAEDEFVGTWGFPIDSWWDTFKVLLDRLARRDLTGLDATQDACELLTTAPSQAMAKWGARIVNKNLRAGVQLTTANKVFPGLIEPFLVALAKPYDPEKHELSGAWIVEPKLDGLRMIVVGGRAFTRNGRTIETVSHILKELEPHRDLYVFDGEVMGAGDFDEASGNIRRKTKDAASGIVYHIFDVVPLDQWNSRLTVPLSERKSILLRTISRSQHIRAVDWIDLTTNPTAEELFGKRDAFMKLGYEGAMLKDLSAPYEFERSDSLLKLKDFVELDGIVVDIYRGKGRHKNRLGGFVVSHDDGKLAGVSVMTKVGGGFSDELREKIWADGKSFLGRTVECQYQNRTEDGRMRFPIFLRFRGDKD